MRLSRTELGDLSVFAAVARHRSFKRAGLELGLSTSALSHSLRALEERIGVRLVNRTTRAVVPTEAGEALLARLAPALDDIGDALAAATGARHEPAGTLRLNVPGTAARMVLGPVVTPFLERHPRVRLEIVSEERMVDVVAAGYDAGIRFGDTVPRDMVSVRIGFAHRFAVVGSPAYFARHPAPRVPADLAAHRCIRWAFTGGGFMRWGFERGGEVLELEVDGPLAVNEPELIHRAALDGLGLAYTFDRSVERDVADGRLARALEDWCPERPGFSLYYPSRRQIPPALRALIDMLKG